MKRVMCWFTYLFTALLLVAAAPVAAVAAPNDWSGFPTADETDGKFIDISGPINSTPYIPTVFYIAIPADATSFDIDVFDGDSGISFIFPPEGGFLVGPDANYDLNYGPPVWPTVPSTFSYRLIPDPLKDFSTTTPVVTKSSTDFVDSAWAAMVSGRPVDASAKAPTGHYFYRIEVTYDGDANADAFLNGFKVRVRQQGGSRQADISVFQQVSVVGAPINSFANEPALNTPGNTNNGVWDFVLVLTRVVSPSVMFRENDADHVSDLLPPDSISPGVPKDDNVDAPERIIAPNIRYEIFDPDNNSIRVELDPSGNLETEVFDYAPVYGAPAGGYLWRWSGVDVYNTYSLFADNEFYALNCNGDCLSPFFRVGDTVWLDANGNGVQDTGEAGIGGVVVNLLDGIGNVIDSTNTAANGKYVFPSLYPGNYTVQVVAGNFDSGNPLAGLISTTGGETITDTVVATDVLTYDFGYIPATACDGACDGKVTTLTLKYNGTTPANIQVYQHKIDTALFAGTVNPGDQFTINGLDSKGTLGPNVYIYSAASGVLCRSTSTVDGGKDKDKDKGKDSDKGKVKGKSSGKDKDSSKDKDKDSGKDKDRNGTSNSGCLLIASFHTSCSQPIGPGTTSGDFVVVEGASRNGGPLPPLFCQATPPDECKADDGGKDKDSSKDKDKDGGKDKDKDSAKDKNKDSSSSCPPSGKDKDKDSSKDKDKDGGKDKDKDTTSIEGCTPGYWKQAQHFFAWTGYGQSQSFDTVFSVDAPGNNTLLQALQTGGGDQYALGRHAVAALLNSTSNGVNYLYSTADVMSMVQQAYASGNFESTKNLFATQNEAGCPLGNNK